MTSFVLVGFASLTQPRVTLKVGTSVEECPDDSHLCQCLRGTVLLMMSDVGGPSLPQAQATQGRQLSVSHGEQLFLGDSVLISFRDEL